MPIDQVFGGEVDGGLQRRLAVGDAVVLLVAALQALEDLHGLVAARLQHLDLLEATGERLVAIEARLEVIEGSAADAAQLAVRQRGLEEVGGVHRAAAGGASAHQHVDLVDEQDGAGLFRQCPYHGLQSLFELAAELGPGEQGAEIEREERGRLEDLRHLLLVDGHREALGQRRLAHARLAHVDGIVLAAAAEHLHRPLQLVLAPDQRVDASLGRALDQVDAIGGERVVGRAAILVVALRLRVQLVVASAVGAQAAVVADLECPVRDEPQEVEARDSLFLQQVESVGIAFPEERHQHRPGVDGLLAARLHLHRRPLQHALEGAGLLRVAIESVRQLRLAFQQVLLQLALQFLKAGPAGAQDAGRHRVAQQRVQQVLQRHVLVPPRLRLREGQPQGGFQLLGDRQAHSGSIVLKKGNSAALAICSTVATFVSAIS